MCPFPASQKGVLIRGLGEGIAFAYATVNAWAGHFQDWTAISADIPSWITISLAVEEMLTDVAYG